MEIDKWDWFNELRVQLLNDLTNEQMKELAEINYIP